MGPTHWNQNTENLITSNFHRQFPAGDTKKGQKQLKGINVTKKVFCMLPKAVYQKQS